MRCCGCNLFTWLAQVSLSWPSADTSCMSCPSCDPAASCPSAATAASRCCSSRAWASRAARCCGAWRRARAHACCTHAMRVVCKQQSTRHAMCGLQGIPQSSARHALPSTRGCRPIARPPAGAPRPCACRTPAPPPAGAPRPRAQSSSAPRRSARRRGRSASAPRPRSPHPVAPGAALRGGWRRPYPGESAPPVCEAACNAGRELLRKKEAETGTGLPCSHAAIRRFTVTDKRIPHGAPTHLVDRSAFEVLSRRLQRLRVRIAPRVPRGDLCRPCALVRDQLLLRLRGPLAGREPACVPLPCISTAPRPQAVSQACRRVRTAV